MAVEYRLVNDNGVQKVIKLDITEPKKKGMSADTAATIVNGDIRTILPLKGDAPISSEEVSIEEWAPTYPGSPTNTWKSSTKSFTDEEIPSLIQRVRNLLKLPNRLQTGGWLAKFDLGGTVQQPESDKQKRMKELLLIINGAAKELSTKQPGDNVAYLVQVMQDPQEVELIEAIVAEIPDAQEIIDQVSQLSSQMFKCGGKTKKKVKKGAKGCIPCKKLMKIGGRLTNVLVDCEGNIIKHATGGWIRKGQIGLNTAGIVKDQFKQDNLSADNAANLPNRYFLKSDGTLGYQTWDSSAKSWKDGAFNIDNFNTWNESNNMFADGFVYDHTTNMGHFNGDETKARAAMGQAYDNQKYIVSGNTVNGVTGASGHKALGTLGKDPTRRDALNQSGGLAKEINASLQQESDDLATVKNDWKIKRSTIWSNGLQKGDWAALRESRQTRKTQSKGIKQAANADRLAWITEANKMASEKLGKQPEVTTPTVTPTKAKKVSVKTSPGDGTYTPRFAKQGGWLTKFN